MSNYCIAIRTVVGRPLSSNGWLQRGHTRLFVARHFTCHRICKEESVHLLPENGCFDKLSSPKMSSAISFAMRHSGRLPAPAQRTVQLVLFKPFASCVGEWVGTVATYVRDMSDDGGGSQPGGAHSVLLWPNVVSSWLHAGICSTAWLSRTMHLLPRVDRKVSRYTAQSWHLCTSNCQWNSLHGHCVPVSTSSRAIPKWWYLYVALVLRAVSKMPSTMPFWVHYERLGRILSFLLGIARQKHIIEM